MDRRSFFKGAFGGVTAAGIVLAGSTSDIEAFSGNIAPGSPVIMGPEATSMARGISVGEILFNSRGEIVGVLREVRQAYDDVLTSAYADRSTKYRRGLVNTIGTIQISGQVFNGA